MFKVGDKVLAKGNYEDEQLGEFAPYGILVVTGVRIHDETFLIQTDKDQNWVWGDGTRTKTNGASEELE